MTIPSDAQILVQEYEKHEKQGNITPPKKHSSLLPNPKETKIYKLPEGKFKIITLRTFSKIQENTDRQFDEIRKTTNALSEKFNKDL